MIGFVTTHALIGAEAIVPAALEQGPSLQYLSDAVSLAGAHVERVIEAVVANRQEAELLSVEVGAPVMLVRRLLSDAMGNPVEHYRGAYRGDRFQYIASGKVHEVETQSGFSEH